MRRFVDLLFRPIARQFPFIIAFMLLMGTIPMLHWIHGEMLTPEEGVLVSRLIGNVAIWFLMAYLLATIIDLANKKWVKIFIYGITLIFCLVQQFLIANFDTKISCTILNLVAETDQRESSEFLNAFLFSTSSIKVYIEFLIYIALIGIAEKVYSLLYKRSYISSFIKFPMLFVAIGLLIYGGYSSKIYAETLMGQYTGRMDKPNDPFSCTWFSLCEMNVERNRTKTVVEITASMEQPTISPNIDDSLNIVLVIGESYIKHHASLYGYYLNTTPLLNREQEKGNLIVFNDVVSPANNTTIVLKNLLCCNDVGSGDAWFESPFFPAIFKQVGYNVLLWDNQLTLDVNTSGFFGVKNFLYDDRLIELGFSGRNMEGYSLDGELVESYKSDSSKLLGAHNLILFHLQGQHIDASTRFPHTEEFTKFTLDSIQRNDKYLTQEKKQRIADYDNATYYNDWVVNQIINMYRDTNTILVYLSDHGDEVYDYRDQFGREFGTFTKEKLKYQFEVPFMIWCSDMYKELHPEIVESLLMSVDKPFMIDKVCHLLFHIGGIQTSYYKAGADLLNDDYKSGKRIVNMVHDYDQIMAN